MSKKGDVKWFVSCCRNKALKAIAKKAEEEFVNTAIESGALNDFINMTEETADKLNALQAYLFRNLEHKPYIGADACELLTKASWGYGLPEDSGYKSDTLSAFYGGINDRLARYFAKYTIQSNNDKELYALLIRNIAEFAAVSNEYQKLQREIEPMTVVQSIKFLETLGFDVSTLKERTKIKEEANKFNKSLIFVCGDNK